MTPRIVSSNTYMRCFQYKVLNNVLFLNKKLFLFKKSQSPLCFFCKEEDETVLHLYFCCPNVRNLWNHLKFYLAEHLTLPPQTLKNTEKLKKKAHFIVKKKRRKYNKKWCKTDLKFVI